MSNPSTQINYALKRTSDDDDQNGSAWGAVRKMIPMLAQEKTPIIISFIAVLLNAGFNLLGPLVIGFAIDRYVVNGDYQGVLLMSAALLGIFIAAFVANYVQMRVMGGVAQRVLWKLRNDLFAKLQELPLAFFNQNKSGDLISRINSDTEKVNEFFSQNLMRFVLNIVMTIGAGIFILVIQFKLAAASLIPAAFILIFTLAASGWVARRNKLSLEARGAFSAETQESVSNFKVILAFNRRDYFRQKFAETNKSQFKASMGAGVANELFTPVFEFMGNLALLIMLGFGIYLVSTGQFAIGLLVSFVIYVTRFYDPLREMARLWATLQTALAAWDRIGIILNFQSDLPQIADAQTDGKGLIEFRNVSFKYVDGKDVLHDVNFVFEKGKTYALVGPTGGGKTTTASLIARLFDPTAGTVYLNGKDIRSYDIEERTSRIGFILQEPFLFSGSVRENLLYGTAKYENHSVEQFDEVMKKTGLEGLLTHFEKGLDTHIGSVEKMSLGERQIIAFMRAVLREPDILILDEATANIDTVTEKVLEQILEKLPQETTRVIIAHRLNTIQNADDIFFVNNRELERAGSMEHALDMLLHGQRKS